MQLAGQGPVPGGSSLRPQLCSAADSEEVRAALRDERLQALIQQIDSAPNRPKVRASAASARQLTWTDHVCVRSRCTPCSFSSVALPALRVHCCVQQSPELNSTPFAQVLEQALQRHEFAAFCDQVRNVTICYTALDLC